MRAKHYLVGEWKVSAEETGIQGRVSGSRMREIRSVASDKEGVAEFGREKTSPHNGQKGGKVRRERGFAIRGGSTFLGGGL